MESNIFDFLVLGVRKCGTQYLLGYLEKSPEIALVDQLKYLDDIFTDHHPKNIPSQYGKKKGYYASNLLHQKDHQFLRKYAPNGKALIMVRNPVKRAYSSFQFDLHRGKHNITDFDYAVRTAVLNYSEKEKLPSVLRTIVGIFGRVKVGRFLEFGLYHKYISNLLEIFPAEDVCIIDIDQWDEETRFMVSRFLQIKDFDYVPSKEARHKTDYNSRPFSFLVRKCSDKIIFLDIYRKSFMVRKFFDLFIKLENRLNNKKCKIHKTDASDTVLRDYFKEDVNQFRTLLKRNPQLRTNIKSPESLWQDMLGY